MIDVRKCLCVRSYADDVQCYFSFDRDSSVYMIKNKIRAPKVLNSLPLSLREIETLYLFKQRLKAYYLNLTYEDITTVCNASA